MSTIHLQRTSTATLEQYVAASLISGLVARSSLETAPTLISKCITEVGRRPMSRKAQAESGSVYTTTGPIPTASYSRRPTRMSGVARPGTPILSRVCLTA